MIHDLDEARRERAAFAALIGESSRSAQHVDAETIWKAVAGELSAEETGRLLDLAAESAEVAEAWRLARELQTLGTDAATTRPVVPLRRWPVRVAVPVGMAAALILAVGLWPGLWERPSSDPPAYRTTAGHNLETTMEDGNALPREQFLLLWLPAEGEGWRYGVRVTTEDLRELDRARDLVEPEYHVPSSVLEATDSGSRIYWRVEAEHTDGRRRSSQTFFVTLQ